VQAFFPELPSSSSSFSSCSFFFLSLGMIDFPSHSPWRRFSLSLSLSLTHFSFSFALQEQRSDSFRKSQSFYSTFDILQSRRRRSREVWPHRVASCGCNHIIFNKSSMNVLYDRVRLECPWCMALGSSWSTSRENRCDHQSSRTSCSRHNVSLECPIRSILTPSTWLKIAKESPSLIHVF
jgi:hypothetical protein